ERFCSRDDLCVTHGVAGGTRVVSRSGSFGTRGVTGVCPGKAHARHVSHAEASGEYHSRNSRRTRRLPGGSYRLGYSGHVAYSHGTRRILSAWVFGTRGSLELLPDVVSR